jgi:hypothetical protein
LDECAIEVTCLKAVYLERTAKLGNKCHVHRGASDNAIKRVCKKYNMEREDINLSTVLSRMKPGHKFKVKHRGTVSPMIGIDAHLLGIILRRSDLRHPVSCAEGLELANSLTEGTHAQVDLMEWKEKHLKMGETDASFGSLDEKYWQNFCRRNEDVITALAVRFDSKRDDWFH